MYKRQAHAYALEQGTFDQKVFYEAFGIFDNQSIEKSLVSENPLVRIFALLDRRLGKRRLLALEESMEQELDWVRAFYVIRLQACLLYTSLPVLLYRFEVKFIAVRIMLRVGVHYQTFQQRCLLYTSRCV